MRHLIAAVCLSLVSSLALAQTPTCADKAAEKKLAGAAKNSFMKKCERESHAASAAQACAAQAADKKLKGAAKNSFTKKCEREAAASAASAASAAQ